MPPEGSGVGWKGTGDVTDGGEEYGVDDGEVSGGVGWGDGAVMFGSDGANGSGVESGVEVASMLASSEYPTPSQ